MSSPQVNSPPKPQLRDLLPLLHQTTLQSWEALKLLFWITFPIVLGLRIIEEFVPLIDIVGGWLEPIMNLVGLPGIAAVPWAAAMLLQPLPGYALLADNWIALDLTIAQATIFSILVLEVHAIFVELRIAQLLGVRMWVTLVMRFGAAVLLGVSLNWLYLSLDWLQEPATLLFEPSAATATERSWLAWGQFQLKSWGMFAAILFFLNFLMQLIRIFNLERFLIQLLSPLMVLMGIHKKAATTAIIGLVLGLSYGAALLVDEKNSRKVPARDVFLTVALLGICHSLLDDTIIAVLFGAHISGVLFVRVGFAIGVIALLSRLCNALPAPVMHKVFMVPEK